MAPTRITGSCRTAQGGYPSRRTESRPIQRDVRVDLSAGLLPEFAFQDAARHLRELPPAAHAGPGFAGIAGV